MLITKRTTSDEWKSVIELESPKMEDDEEEPPLAVAINDAVSSSTPQPSARSESSLPPPVGVTVITGYLGAGKSTVSPFLFFVALLFFVFNFFFKWSFMLLG